MWQYTPIFVKYHWRDIIRLTDEDLETMGVGALGARRKMIKVFEQIQASI